MSEFLRFQPEAYQQDVARLIRAEVVHLSVLLHLDFKDEPLRLSNRNLPFVDLKDGHTWDAGHHLIVGLPAIDGGDNKLAPHREYRLGLPFDVIDEDWMKMVVEQCRDRGSYTGRTCALYGQLFDPKSLAPVGWPFAYDVGLMDRMTFQARQEGVIVSLTSESMMARKGVPPYGKMTFFNQKDKYPGDLGMQFTTESDRLVEFGAY